MCDGCRVRYEALTPPEQSAFLEEAVAFLAHRITIAITLDPIFNAFVSGQLIPIFGEDRADKAIVDALQQVAHRGKEAVTVVKNLRKRLRKEVDEKIAGIIEEAAGTEKGKGKEDVN